MNKNININAFNKCAGDENGIVNRIYATTKKWEYKV